MTSTSLQLQGTRQRPNSNDFISQMSDDILVMILSLLTIKEAVVTSSLSTRWRFVWCSLTQLNFDGGETLRQIVFHSTLHESACSAYINQVNSVIQSYSHPVVQDFRIRFCLTKHHKAVIDEWLQFAINKKVEFLELNLTNKFEVYDYYTHSDYPLRLFDTKLSTCPSLNATVVEISSLKKLVLKNVKVTETILQEILTNCPHLETLFIYYSSDIKNIHVYGRALKLKHFKIVTEFRVDSNIYLSDFDLVSFTYEGDVADLRLSHLPKLKEVDINGVHAMLDTDVFDQISSCALSLQDLSISIYDPTESLKLDSIPELPSLKKLRLTIGGCKYDCLVYLASILNACPNLETLTLEPDWTSPTVNMRKAKDVTNRNEHLKIVEIVGYYGRKRDVKLVKYIVHTAGALKKIVIDPCWNDAWWVSASVRNFSRDKEASRSAARCQLASVLPQGVDLCIL